MPDIMERTASEDMIPSAGGVSIMVQSWHPVGAAQAVIVIIPGFNAYGGRYQGVAEQFNTHGLAVYAVDLRGRGRSAGERFYVAQFDEYVADVAAAVTLAKAREPDLPLFLLGHSAGGVIACLYALDRQDELAGLICESFSLELPAPDFALAALRGLGHILPHSHLVRLKNADFSRDPDVVKSMDADPLIAGEVQATQTIAEMTRAGERLKHRFSDILLPVLILHGTADAVAKPSGSEHFHDQAGSSDKTLKLYDGHFHDLLHDTGHDDVLSDVNEWVSARLHAHG